MSAFTLDMTLAAELALAKPKAARHHAHLALNTALWLRRPDLVLQACDLLGALR